MQCKCKLQVVCDLQKILEVGTWITANGDSIFWKWNYTTILRSKRERPIGNNGQVFSFAHLLERIWLEKSKTPRWSLVIIFSSSNAEWCAPTTLDCTHLSKYAYFVDKRTKQEAFFSFFASKKQKGLMQLASKWISMENSSSPAFSSLNRLSVVNPFTLVNIFR